MAGLATYDPKNVKVNVGGVPILGFADGTFITVERTSDNFEKITGADNRTTRIKMLNRLDDIPPNPSHSITIRPDPFSYGQGLL